MSIIRVHYVKFPNTQYKGYVRKKNNYPCVQYLRVSIAARKHYDQKTSWRGRNYLAYTCSLSVRGARAGTQSPTYISWSHHIIAEVAAKLVSRDVGKK